MKDHIKNHPEPEETFSDALKSVVQKIEVSARFKDELGKQLAEAHQPVRPGFGQSAFSRALPAFGWMFALALMALVLNWLFRSIAPPPMPAAQETSIPTAIETPTPIVVTETVTSVPEDGGYDWRGTKLYLAQSLSQSPVEADVYLKKLTEQATREDVLVLAQQFGINGEVQEVPGEISGQTDYTISDGRERLQVQSDHSFMYHSNFGKEIYLDNLSEGQARIIIDDFLKKHGFDFEYKLETSPHTHPDLQGQQYLILPLTPGGYKMRFDYMQTVSYGITLDHTGENIILGGYLPIEYESVGTFGIITVDDALQKILNPNPQSGLMESFQGQGGGGGGSSFYKLNLGGTPVPFPSPTAQPQTNQGNIEYVIKEGDILFAIAEAHGITPEKIFQANSWLMEERVLMLGKTLIIPVAELVSQPGDYSVQENDTLSSIALNHGITVDQLILANNLLPDTNMVYTGQKLIIPGGQVTSGRGIPLPEEQLIQLEIGQRLEGERGIFQVNIYETSQRIWYGFFETSIEKSNMPYMILEGADLQNMQKYNNLPINIWGTIDRFDQYGKPVVEVDRYEIPFPDLRFQILEGTQKIIEVQGKQVLAFTTNNGTTYVQIGAQMYPLDSNSLFGNEGDKLLAEMLIIPDEFYAGYPTIRMYSMGYAVDPISGQTSELTITQDQFNTYEEPSTTTEVYIPPTATIEKVELVYFVSNPQYQANDPSAGQREPYIQPAWQFYGHYSNGDEFEILVQALKEEYLLPELAPYTPPG
ncbi:MAG: LysM peptidoglycan-binding domain-containing protein [Anaerolineales bacterium]